MGAIIRAAAEKPEVVDILGLDARRIHLLVFAIGTALAMLAATPEVLEERAARLAREIEARIPGLAITRVAGVGEVGGGALPLQQLPGPVVAVRHPSLTAAQLEQRARAAAPPVIGTVRAGAFRLDPRTLADAEVAMAAVALARVWS